MEILEYDQVDPLEVLHLNLLSLEYALTPERVASIRAQDARPFPFFALYAIEDGVVAGQVGVDRLPVMTTDGPQDVGGVCAVCTRPGFERRGIANRLMDAAHMRMREAGFRFSTLGTVRSWGAYGLYKGAGYEDAFVPTSTLARLEDLRQDPSLVAERVTPAQLDLADAFYQQAAAGYLGFTRRCRNYLAMMAATGDLGDQSLYLLWKGREMAGYALANVFESILDVYNLLLASGQDAAEAVAAVSKGQPVGYVRVRVDHPIVAESLVRDGFPPAQASWSTFMVKPLVSGATRDEACRLLGIGTRRFLISYLDTT